MSNLIPSGGQNPGRSPFDRFCRRRLDGTQYWSGREMQELFGYATWQKFEEVIRRTQDDFCNLGGNCDDHFTRTVKMVSLGSGAQREVPDYELTREACYMVAMNCRTEEASAAKAYFAVQTRRAELLLPPLQPAAVPTIARAWMDRIMPAFEVHKRHIGMNCPDGAWSILTAALGETLLTEEELLRHCLPIEHHNLPDGSMGLMYSKYRKGKPWARPCSSAPLVLPKWRKADGADIPVEVTVYDADERKYFEPWLLKCYFPDHLYNYLEYKFSRREYGLTPASAADSSARRVTGRRAALPAHVLRQIDQAEGGFIPATAALGRRSEQRLLFDGSDE